MELPAKLLDHSLQSNKSNINQILAISLALFMFFPHLVLALV